ncbi:EcsC family protein [Acinetobacter sp. ANC 5502]
MPKEVNQHPQSKFNQVFGVAKKLSTSGLKVLNQMNSQQLQRSQNPSKVVNEATPKPALLGFGVQDPQQLIRVYFPNISKQLFGKHYDRVSQVAEFLSPMSMDEISEYCFQKLHIFSDKLSATQNILQQTGAESLHELSQDISRSGRISQALTEQNKWIAGVQGAISGATGLLGLGVDIPASLVLALRTIYQTGRAHGFALTEQDQDVVQYIFQQINLQQMLEKQSVLLGLRTLDGLLVEKDLTAVQHLLGSNNDDEWLKELLLDENHEFKWQWMNTLPKVSALHHITPLIAASVSAMYSWQFIEDIGQKAQHIFSVSRDYLLRHPEQKISTLAAYHAAVEQFNQAKESAHQLEFKSVNSEGTELAKPKPQRRPRRTQSQTVTEKQPEKTVVAVSESKPKSKLSRPKIAANPDDPS